MKTIILTIILAFAVAFLLGFLLGLFKKVFFVAVDERVTKIREVLPGANCGGCGYPGCDGCAAAIVAGEAPANACTAGGADVAGKIGEILGVSVSVTPMVTVLACQGTKDCAAPRGKYNGIKNCRSAMLTVNGTKMCSFGCIGFGDCVEACPFGAVKMGADGIPSVDYSKCTGCGACAKACPRGLFKLLPADLKGAVPLCVNKSENKPMIRKNCTNGCMKCGKCVRECKQQAIALVNGIPTVDYTKCNACGECVTNCMDHVFKLASDIIK